MMGPARAKTGPAWAMTGATGVAMGAALKVGPTRPGPEATAAWKAAPLEAKWSALAATTAGSSAGVTAPLGWATSWGTWMGPRGPGRMPALATAAEQRVANNFMFGLFCERGACSANV